MLPHANPTTERRFILALGLTIFVLLAEVIGGLWTGSLALLSDSAHVFLDLFALALSFLALRLSALPADDRHTYGYHRLEVLAALLNGLSLGGISIGIFIEAAERFQSPTQVKSWEMLGIAAFGLAINLVVARVLGGHLHPHDHAEGDERGHGDPATTQPDLNLRSAYLHVVGDAISSVGVIVAGLLIAWTGWMWLDPLVSLLIGALILASSWRLLRSALHILVEGVPENIPLAAVSAAITATPGVCDLHDLHVWNICSGRVALSAHVVMTASGAANSEGLLHALRQRLADQFGIQHTTLQLEREACGAEPSLARCR